MIKHPWLVFIPGIFLLTVAFGCASKPVPSIVDVPKDATFRLELMGKPGQEEKIDFYSHTVSQEFDAGQKTKDIDEVLDFVVHTLVKASSPNQFTVRTTTVKKAGMGNLHDFAFPELDESIDFVYSSAARVLKAGDFPKNSIFYLPPLSLPNDPVHVGDTWVMDHFWTSGTDGFPLHLAMVTIFKSVVECGAFGRCADLEISGQVEIADLPLQSKLQFENHLAGRVLFSLDRHDVAWSQINNWESLKIKDHQMHLQSCMISRVEEGKERKLACDVQAKAIVPPNLSL